MILGQRMAGLSRQQCLRLVGSRIFAESPSASSLGRFQLRAAYSSLTRDHNDQRTVIVTGSSRGIGKAIALRLAADGYNVCINDLSANRAGCEEVVKEIQGMGRKAITAIADVTKRDEVKQMVQSSVEKLGPLNTMIANAGIAQVKEILDVTEQEFERMFAINVFGVQNCFAEAAKQMISQGNCKPDSPGKLIAAASVVAFKPFVMLSHYSASKWAVRGLTQTYAMTLADKHITANAYAPGIIGTAMWELIDAGMSKKNGLPIGENMRKLIQEDTAMKRVGTAEDVAKLVSFLASSDSNFVTGQTQIVDGGIYTT
ncbi:NAD(P)-binding protein [Hypoxylon sp. FL0890]|nr:NAD(P)-binding protein [Hypoxylon sp. FL0890]